MWLRELPEGDDQTVNNTSPDKIRALFDTHRNEKVATSKVAEGLRSWYVQSGSKHYILGSKATIFERG